MIFMALYLHQLLAPLANLPVAAIYGFRKVGEARLARQPGSLWVDLTRQFNLKDPGDQLALL